MVEKQVVFDELAQVVDPEIGLPITEMDLIDSVTIEGGDVKVFFHLTSSFCPPFFALKIAGDIKERISKLEGVGTVKVTLTNHYMAEEVNKRINAQT